MTTNSNFSKTLLFLIGVAALGIAVITMAEYAYLINAVFLGIIIVVIAAPMLYWLQDKGLPDWLAFVITLLVLITIGVAFVLFLDISVDQLAAAVPTYVEQAESLQASMESMLSGLGVDTANIQSVLDLIDPAQLLTVIVDILSGISEAVSNLVVVVLVAAFLLAEAMGLRANASRQLSLGQARLARVSQFIHDLREYVVITLRLGLVTGALVTILLLILGVDFPLMWGVLALLLNFIPTIGIWIAMIPPIILALLEFGLTKALIVLVGYLLIDALIENVAKPKFLGEGLNLAPVTIILSLIFWAAVLGPLGALLAVPLTLAVKELVLAADEDSRGLAELMSSKRDTPEEPEPHRDEEDDQERA